MRFRAWLLFLCLPLTAPAQPRPQFEVASIKPNKSGKLDSHWGTVGSLRFEAENVTIRSVILNAWKIREFQLLGGPDWLDDDHIDIQAVIPEGTPYTQVPLMLQDLLQDRLRLKVHLEKREQSVYLLTVARNGPKIAALAPDGCVTVKPGETPPPPEDRRQGCGNSRWGPGRINGIGLPMSQLAILLAEAMERTVIDATNLPGIFTLDLIWTPDNGTAESLATGPSIFTAIQEQLGLRLDASRAPVDVVIIDSIDHPSEN